MENWSELDLKWNVWTSDVYSNECTFVAVHLICLHTTLTNILSHSWSHSLDLLDSYVNDTTHFSKVHNLFLEENDILVSFELLKQYLKQIFTEDVANLFGFCLTTTAFSLNTKCIYEQTDSNGKPFEFWGGSKFCMGKFEQPTINTARYKQKERYRYFNKHVLQKLLIHNSGIHDYIQFGMETKGNYQLAFLEVLLTRKLR